MPHYQRRGDVENTGGHRKLQASIKIKMSEMPWKGKSMGWNTLPEMQPYNAER